MSSDHGMLKMILSLAGLSLISGCAPDDLPKVQEIAGLRVLAIKASQPEVNLSSLPTTVNLTPFIADRDGGGRSVEVTGRACLDPGVSLGAEPTCEGVSGVVTLSGYSVTPTGQAANSQVFGSPSYIGSIPSLSIPLPSLPALTAIPAIQLFNGVGYLVTLEIRAGSEVRRAHKRILISTKAQPNTNPSINSVLQGGQALAALPNQTVELSIAASVNPATYEFKTESGETKTRVKATRVTHFISDGSSTRASSLPSESVKWTPPATAPAGRPVTIVSVLVDGVGGVDVRVTDL